MKIILQELKNALHIFQRGHPFSSGGRACDLCLTEKLTILTADQNSMLNKRDELLETCRHRRKHLLVSLFAPPPQQKGTPRYHYQVIRGNLKFFFKKTLQFKFNSSPNLNPQHFPNLNPKLNPATLSK